MSEQVNAIANGPWLWAVTIFALVVVFGQAFLYLKKSWEACHELNIPKETLRKATKASCISAIGPSIVIVSTLLSLMVNVGAPTALMRLSYIGNVSFELQAASRAASVYGVDLTPEAMTPEILFVAIACMAFGCIGFLIVPIFFIKQMDKLKNMISGGNMTTMTAITGAAVLGAIAYYMADYTLALSAKTVAAYVGFIAMCALTIIKKKFNAAWISEWGLTIAMFSGMILAALV